MPVRIHRILSESLLAARSKVVARSLVLSVVVIIITTIVAMVKSQRIE